MNRKSQSVKCIETGYSYSSTMHCNLWGTRINQYILHLYINSLWRSLESVAWSWCHLRRRPYRICVNRCPLELSLEVKERKVYRQISNGNTEIFIWSDICLIYKKMHYSDLSGANNVHICLPVTSGFSQNWNRRLHIMDEIKEIVVNYPIVIMKDCFTDYFEK